jgi:hypothetical protein
MLASLIQAMTRTTRMAIFLSRQAMCRLRNEPGALGACLGPQLLDAAVKNFGQV